MTELFPLERQPDKNLLPYDGEVLSFGSILSLTEAARYEKELLVKVSWRPDEVVMFGKHIITKREMAWYADFPLDYTYSNKTRSALPWISVLVDLKNRVQSATGDTYNSCLANLYHDGTEGMGYHSDGESELQPGGSIASLSFGAERRFIFKHKKTGEKVQLMLPAGTLLVMKGATQQHWVHSLPVMRTVKAPRINLTFRQMLVP